MPAGVSIFDADPRQASQSVCSVSVWLARSPFRQTKSGWASGASLISSWKTESLCRVEGSDGVGLAPVHFAAVPVVEDDAPVALVQDDSPLHDAVAVGRAGLESFDPHPVHASDAAKSEMRVVIPGPFGRVEVRSVHRGEFDPADGVGLCVPDDREAVFGDIQYIGSVCDAYRRRHGGLGEGGGRQQERAQQQGKSFHGESCIGSKSKGMFLFSFIQFFVLLIRKEMKYIVKRKFFRRFWLSKGK